MIGKVDLAGALITFTILIISVTLAEVPANDLEKINQESSFWKRNSAFWKRDTDALLEHEANGDEYANEEASKRARNRFLGKRGQYSFGKRPRNNFLGKRTDTDMDDFNEDLEELKRARPQFLGKRGRQHFLGKRPRLQFLGKRDEYPGYLLPGEESDFSIDDVKRTQHFDDLGSEDIEEILKRARNRFLGRR